MLCDKKKKEKIDCKKKIMTRGSVRGRGGLKKEKLRSVYKCECTLAGHGSPAGGSLAARSVAKSRWETGKKDRARAKRRVQSHDDDDFLRVAPQGVLVLIVAVASRRCHAGRSRCHSGRRAADVNNDDSSSSRRPRY